MTQGSADPPEHEREGRVPGKLQHRSPNADAAVGERPRLPDEGEIPRAADGAREPAPGEANRLADKRTRGGDQRSDAFD